MTEFAVVHPCSAISGVVRVPGDKSISHRVAMLSAVASGESTIDGFLRSEDCLNTLKAVAALGAQVSVGPDVIKVTGTGGVFRQPESVLDLGNSGTGIRLLTGLLAGQPITAELTGDVSLRSRPMSRIKEPLERMGARIELLGARGCAPIRITGGGLHGITYVLPVASAQVKSCVLLAGLFAKGETTVTEPRPTRDHTERLLQAMGVPLAIDGLTVRLAGGNASARLAARHWVVPGDISSAAFWITAAACRPGAEVVVENVGLNSRRTALLDVLRRMGADIAVEHTSGVEAGEAIGTVAVKGARLRGTEVRGDEIPKLIDELPLVAVAGALATGETIVREAEELRVKESDRIATMARNLAGMGVDVKERPDGWSIRGPARVHPQAAVESLGDHRVAMAMTVLALYADAPVRVNDTGWIATSYPGFWDDLKKVGGHAEQHRND